MAWLILVPNMRVGDEKDPDEADTVGAITLRKEHIKIVGDTLHFDFLGKDSVRWVKEYKAPPEVIKNIRALQQNKQRIPLRRHRLQTSQPFPLRKNAQTHRQSLPYMEMHKNRQRRTRKKRRNQRRPRLQKEFCRKNGKLQSCRSSKPQTQNSTDL